MAYDNTGVSDESDTNIKFGWAYQILQIINQVNTYNYLCTINDFSALRPMYGHMTVLRDMLSAKFPKEIDKVDDKLKLARESLEGFERRRFSMFSDNQQRMKGREVHNHIRGVYDEIMLQMKYHGILDTIRMDVKTMARRSWYGDARPTA